MHAASVMLLLASNVVAAIEALAVLCLAPGFS